MKDIFCDKVYIETVLSEIVDGVDRYLKSLNEKNVSYGYKKGVNGCSQVVSDADKTVEKICISALNASFPELSIIAEESYIENSNTAIDTFFVIDPIDGTSNFLKGGSDWSVSIALIYENKPIIGYLYFAKKGIQILAMDKMGVWFNGQTMTRVKKKADLKIAVSPNQISSIQLLEILARNSLNYATIPHFTPKILALITGETNAAVYLPQNSKFASLWDYAAASLVLHELGGQLRSLSGAEMVYSGNKVIHTEGWIATDTMNNYNYLSHLFSEICLDKECI